MQIRLSPRLKAVAAQVPRGACVVDVGTDHAYLPIWLMQQGRVARAIAVDVAAGPLERAKDSVRSWSIDVEVRRSDGLNAIEAGEADCVTICGMGGLTVANIIAEGAQALARVERIIVQPQGMAGDVRRTLLALGWGCVEACLVAERSKLYVVESWERCASRPVWSPADIRWGRMIRGRPDPLYQEQLRRELADLEQALGRLCDSGQGDHPDALTLNAEKADLVAELVAASGLVHDG